VPEQRVALRTKGLSQAAGAIAPGDPLPTFERPRVTVARLLTGNHAEFETGRSDPVVIIDDVVLSLGLLREMVSKLESMVVEDTAARG
jgi:hypothetical protein